MFKKTALFLKDGFPQNDRSLSLTGYNDRSLSLTGQNDRSFSLTGQDDLTLADGNANSTLLIVDSLMTASQRLVDKATHQRIYTQPVGLKQGPRRTLQSFRLGGLTIPGFSLHLNMNYP